MAQKTIRIGSLDAVQVYDDGDWSSAIETDHTIKVGTAPAVAEDVLRLDDIGGIVGDVSGPAASTDNAIVRFDGITGKIIQDSLVTIDNAGSISLPAAQTVDGVDISAHAIDADAHHNELHDIDTHSDTSLGALANDDLMQWDDPSTKWEPKSIAEVIAGQNIAPGNVESTGEVSANAKSKMTSEGGFAVRLTNKTGVASVKGQLVAADTTTNDAVALTGVSDTECFGVFYESGIADGSEVWVIIAGIADVLFEDNHGPTRGDWVSTGSEAGYAFSQASPAAAPTHFEEIGHCIETVAAGGAGTHVAARCILHFN